ncbi:MOSC domain-containing protein [Mycolicibacterium vaccae]|uniref:MOSC domain-containing protein n=1 Tax=Mycolicibacterium vaccae ATCC 25954 TaxID=1194972 RepID=K0V0B0_MYCVA|nr:MOSC domain-containing protein [Mycolicibacterium vaccae]ANI42731.1 molybdenum cofactor biosysynthesis protein [Mycolicibacterium vaccae 95051]EJZ10790.1 MOSC domain-containing protein [Mycolicibacterium vaccae ATCC 25954]MCV7062854.1 MOSC domain-containing protein [Mycolicibacterium vaccae]
MASVLTVNTATSPVDLGSRKSGIDKRPSAEPLAVRAPGPRKGGLGSGVVGDSVCDSKYHGGDDQAVYAYAREDLDHWAAQLDRELTNGMFGENITTSGVDLSACLIGERWTVGDDGLLLEVTSPRTPCRTFATWLDVRGWMKTFTAAGLPGAYFRVIEPGTIRAGDRVEVVHRPDHTVTVGTVFRAMMGERALLPELAVADALPDKIKAKVAKAL